MAVGQVLGCLFQEDGIVQYVLRFYVITLCILSVFVEMEWTQFARDSAILKYWPTRGLFYCFLGVIGLQQNETSTEKNASWRAFNISKSFLHIVAWLIFAAGFIYLAMGVTCLQIYYNRLRIDYEDRLSRAEDVRRTAERLGERNV